MVMKGVLGFERLERKNWGICGFGMHKWAFRGRFEMSTVGVSVLVLFSSSPYSLAAAAFSIFCLIFRPVLKYPNGRHSTEEDGESCHGSDMYKLGLP